MGRWLIHWVAGRGPRVGGELSWVGFFSEARLGPLLINNCLLLEPGPRLSFTTWYSLLTTQLLATSYLDQDFFSRKLSLPDSLPEAARLLASELRPREGVASLTQVE